MTKPISTRMHGVIDYAWAAAAGALPRTLEQAPATARLLHGAALAATLSSITTKYEAGMLRVMPMRGHLAIDAVMCSVLMASALFLPARERRWSFVPAALGVAGLITGLMTQTRSPVEDRDLALGYADRHENPYLRTHMA